MKNASKEYLEYPSVKKIYDAVAGTRRLGSIETVSSYAKSLKKFVKYLGYSDPETALKDMQSGKVNAGEKVDAFIGYALDELGNSHSSVRSYAFGVKKWLDLNGVKVDWKRIEMPASGITREEDRSPSKDDLKKLLNHASSSRDRAVIFVASSSGLRIGTLLSLKVGDVSFDYPDVARLTVERKRGRKFGSSRGRNSGRYFVSWITPEARTAVEQYLGERKAAGEHLTPDSPLIGDSFNRGEFQTVRGYQGVWHRLLKRAGLAEKSQNWFKLHIHVLRKFFRSNCIGVDASYRERWMGHHGLYLDMSYFKAEESAHLAEYRKAVPHLTIYALPTEEKKLRSQMLVDFAKLQGFGGDELKKLEEVLARSKDIDEGIALFRKFKEDTTEASLQKPKESGNRHFVVQGSTELIRKLDEGAVLVQNLAEDKWLLKF